MGGGGKFFAFCFGAWGFLLVWWFWVFWRNFRLHFVFGDWGWRGGLGGGWGVGGGFFVLSSSVLGFGQVVGVLFGPGVWGVGGWCFGVTLVGPRGWLG